MKCTDCIENYNLVLGRSSQQNLLVVAKSLLEWTPRLAPKVGKFALLVKLGFAKVCSKAH